MRNANILPRSKAWRTCLKVGMLSVLPLCGVLWFAQNRSVHAAGTGQATQQQAPTAPATPAQPGRAAQQAGAQTGAAAGPGRRNVMTPEQRAHIEAGNNTFQQNCAFCHGRDAGGGESGPDLTRSQIVLNDNNGDKIGDVVHNGRPPRMPAFAGISDTEVSNIAAFLHAQQLKAAMSGQRKGVEAADLQTGNAAAGKIYFEGAGGCAKCHSGTGDLAHIAGKYPALQLEEHMLFPREAKSNATVTLPSGEKLSGVVEYRDEFTLGIMLADGTYRSWPVGRIKYTLDSPQDAHAALFEKYTDADIHNLMAYLQTLR